jgi:type VI secretion system protein VasG
MTGVDIKRLLEKCNTFCTQALYDAASLAVGRTHYEVATEHFLLKCLEDKDADIPILLDRYGVDRAGAVRDLTRALDEFRNGNSARPGFSPVLIDLLETAWLVSSVDLGQGFIRSGAVALAYAKRPAYYSQSGHAATLAQINREEATSNFRVLTEASRENAPTAADESVAGKTQAVAGAQGFIAQFCEDFTAKARAGKIDTVFGRDAEIREVLTILARRRKNNPILVGEPGVGKTAVIEGLAKRIVEGDCPASLCGVALLALDMGLLEAGASMKGEFERRLKGVIDEIKGSATPIILFIDEAHMLVGAGGQAGGSDAANLLKPALARGELRTCAATTWKEYKKYFEKDPALARRFQLISLEEPDTASAALILRGLRESYEKAHHVVVQDDAITSAVELSHRFITGRFLPDKAIDLLDTACAKVKMSLSVKPAPLEDSERGTQALERELNALARDAANGGAEETERMAGLRERIAGLQEKTTDLTARWTKERAAAEAFIAARDAYAKALESRKQAEKSQGTDPAPAPAEAAESGAPAEAAVPEAPAEGAPSLEERRRTLDEARAELEAAQGAEGLLTVAVTPDVVAQVVSDWTGIPVGKLAREEAVLVADLGAHLAERIKGQDAAVEAVSRVIKASKAGLRAPGAPIGVFLLAGPSGVGKTETGLALADLLFGDEESAITINMSEFQERHTVSRLIGSPPGYVGYGEGGLLTEAVRRRPYSVILLDEAEKAHPDVMNLFYQVFDKGELTDGEGKKVSFGSTVILLTSNLGAEKLCAAAEKGVTDNEELKTLIHQELAGQFKPALLARMTVVPYLPLDKEALERIARMKLDALGVRLRANNGIALRYSGALVETIVARCGEVDTGARNIDHILAANVLPQLAQTLLEKMSGGAASASEVSLDVAADGAFSMTFDDSGAQPRKSRSKRRSGPS